MKTKKTIHAAKDEDTMSDYECSFSMPLFHAAGIHDLPLNRTFSTT